MTKLQRYLVHGSVTAVAVFFADMFAHMGYVAISWFLAGAIMGLSIQYVYVAAEKRRVGRVLLAMVLTGAASGGVAFIVYGL